MPTPMQPPMVPLEINVERIIRRREVITEFQPLVSVKNRSVVGLEALSRGCLPSLGVSIPPGVLFQLAGPPETRLRLDRACRAKALERFKPIHDAKRDILLSINIDSSLVYRSNASSKVTYDLVTRTGVNPGNVVIEILESHVEDVAGMNEFIATYRDLGFLIALDDIGSGHSNLDRISRYKPDIIKIDRGLIHDIDREYYKQETTRALVRLAGSIGAMVVGEGVEREEEVLTLMEMGVDIFQGFYFCRPDEFSWPDLGFLDKTRDCAAGFKDRIIATINAKKRRHEAYETVLRRILTELAEVSEEDFNAALVQAIGFHPDLECLYILDQRGRQVTSTMCNPDTVSETRRFIYRPAPQGADHSLKDYFLPLSAGLKRYTTEPYISMASGNLCITISICFRCRDGSPYILCVDISEQPADVLDLPSPRHGHGPTCAVEETKAVG